MGQRLNIPLPEVAMCRIIGLANFTLATDLPNGIARPLN